MSLVIGLSILVVLLAGSLLALWKQSKDRERQLQQNQQKKMDQFRRSLFTRLTQDLRTPLTVISGATNQLLTKTTESSTELNLIQTNAERLLKLMNRLEDQSKLESGQLTLNVEQSDIINHLQQLIDSWRIQAKDQQITLTYQTDQEHFFMDFDRVRFVYIVSDLLNWAFQHTPEDGHIQLKTSIKQDTNHQEQLLLTVLNTQPSESEGQGNRADVLKEHRFITDLLMLMQGELQSSKIVSEDTYQQILKLPVTRSAPKIELPIIPATQQTQSSNTERLILTEQEDAPLILIAEDNPNLVDLLSQILGQDYNLIIARNGQQGIDLALRHVPDVIVTDVMMPQKDGYELCYTLKNHELTSHIPIIMMSAKTGKDSRMVGLRQGADLYLEKPFDPDELGGLVDAVLEQRRRLQAYYLSVSGLSEEEIIRPASNLPDRYEDAFLQKVRQLVEAHLEQEDFSVEQLSQLLFMDASNLYRKVKALTGLSPVQYIQSLRLRLAKKLLLESDEPVTQIAIACGFNSSGYFARVFKKDTGMTPSAYRKQGK